MVRTFINRLMANGLLLGLLLASGLAQAELRIFACEPEWAALARELVPDATIDVATSHVQDPHYVQARPSLIAKMRQADLVICSGAELEIGWLPALLQKANNAAVMDPQRGLFYAAEQVERLDVQAHSDRSQGDVHAAGNPHVHLSPEHILTIANALAPRLQLLQPQQLLRVGSTLYRRPFESISFQEEPDSARAPADSAAAPGDSAAAAADPVAPPAEA